MGHHADARPNPPDSASGRLASTIDRWIQAEGSAHRRGERGGGLTVRTLVVALAVQLALGGVLVWFAVTGWPVIGGDAGGREAAPPARSGPPASASALAPRPTVDRFDSARAWRDLRMQVARGPRPAGSRTARRLAARLRGMLPEGRIEAVPGGLRNVVGRLPGRAPAIAIAAHYDTKDLPGFVGANDGAGGVAAVLELARALRRWRPRGGPELRFVLFDGEESPRGTPDADFERRGLRGSRAYAARHADELRALVLLDFVADRDLAIPRETSSDAEIWARLRAAARRVGVARVFPEREQGAILDDHTPFVRAGVPAIDLIDFDFPCWHRRCDDLSGVSARSLDATGEAVVELVRAWPRG